MNSFYAIVPKINMDIFKTVDVITLLNFFVSSILLDRGIDFPVPRDGDGL